MKVSVIVPVYNTATYLEKCLDSLVNQTLESIEIIVVNDGSEDDSQKIIEAFAREFPQIKSYQKINGGLSDARNYGIDQAKGDFIGFVDSDDYVLPNMLEKMYELAIKNKAEVVLCDLEKVDENYNSIRVLHQSKQLPEKIELKSDFTIFGEIDCFACNKLFSRKLFENVRFKKGIHFEDVQLIPLLILRSTIIAKLNFPFYKYLERQNSITKSHTQKGLDMFLAIEEVKEKFEESSYSFNKYDFKRFVSIQGFYAFLAYTAFVKDKGLKKIMLETALEKMVLYKVSKRELFLYKRFGKNYLVSLPLKKQIYYLLCLINYRLVV